MLFDLVYLVGVLLGWPVIAWLLIRKARVRRGLLDRLGLRVPRLAATGRPLVWIHGVSVGEVVAARPLVRELERALPEVDIAVSASTGTGHEVARKSYPGKTIFYCPLDLRFAVRRVLRAVRPAALVLVELEIWPNLIRETALAGVPIVVVNGRITERTARVYRRFGWLFRGLFARLARVLAQDEAYRERFLSLGVEPGRVEVTGSLKYDALDPAAGAGVDGEAVRRELGIEPGAPVIVGGSTHPGEEAALVRALQALRGACPGLTLVVVPRHNERGAEVAGEVRRLGERAVRKTELDRRRGAAGSGDTGAGGDALGSAAGGLPPVVVGDTIGDLVRLYVAADVVFVGGSLVPVGGQNMLEPCGLGKAVVFGPRTHNFRDSVVDLIAAKGAIEVPDEAALVVELGRLLGDRQEARAQGERGRAAIERRRGAAARTAAAIGDVLVRSGAIRGQG